jgi:Xaa-Pro aminopeptidase
MLSPSSQELDERVKQGGFTPEGLGEARRKTWAALERIAGTIESGMLEAEAAKQAQAILKEMGSPTFWHRTHIRFGKNTLCTFLDPSAPDTRLGENDIFFVDLGPVWEHGGLKYEGDAGITGVVGKDPEHRAAASVVREIFDASHAEWKKGVRTGKELYDWMATETERRGWQLQLKADGHRVSDFPHKLYCGRGVGELDYRPSPDLWVLEVQIRHPTRDFGAFYEDVLI